MVDLCVQADIEKYLNISFSNNPDPTVAVYIDRVSAVIGMVCNLDFGDHSGDLRVSLSQVLRELHVEQPRPLSMTLERSP